MIGFSLPDVCANQVVEYWQGESTRRMEPNFILAPGSDPLSALWGAFPELRDEWDDGDSESYYILNDSLTILLDASTITNSGKALMLFSSRWLSAGEASRKSW